ncbi:hypothetical protein ACLOJK_013734, partial [Asimina triloba]
MREAPTGEHWTVEGERKLGRDGKGDDNEKMTTMTTWKGGGEGESESGANAMKTW